MSVLAIIPLVAMWLDDLTIGETAPTGDCDAVGLSGAAGAALSRAGWLFFAAAILCLVSAVAFSGRTQAAGRASSRKGSPAPTGLSN